jgi:hypothetical protein
MDLDIETPDVTLTTPVYNVTHIKLISARVPNTQLLINQYNNTFVYSATTYSVPLGTYTTGDDLASAFNASGSGVTATYDANTHALAFTDDFEPGPWLSKILGYPGGVIDLTGPLYLTLRLTVGSDVVTRTVYQKDTECHYLGKILTGPIGDVIHYTETLDTVEMNTQIKTIQTMRLDFLNPDGSVYDFGGRTYILKFRLTCSTDKLIVTKDDTVTQHAAPELFTKPFVSSHTFIIIAAIVALTLGLFILMLNA